MHSHKINKNIDIKNSSFIRKKYIKNELRNLLKVQKMIFQKEDTLFTSKSKIFKTKFKIKINIENMKIKIKKLQKLLK